MGKRTAFLIVLVVGMLGFFSLAISQTTTNEQQVQPGYSGYGMGPGMMGGYGGGYGMGPGMMGGYGGGYGMGPGMMGGYGQGNGYGPGMMGSGNYNYPNAYTRKKIEEKKLKAIAEDYLSSTGDSDLTFTGYIEYAPGYAVGFKEKSTGLHAFEIYIDKQSESVYLEMGPYMMWNAKYGHMGMMGGYSYNPTAQMPISEKKAINLAEDYIKGYFPKATVDKDAETFYGFYEFVIKVNGKPFSHLFINGYTGQYWYFNPHGRIFQIKKFS